MQLDLFLHNRSVMLRNDLIQALRARHPVMGREAHAKLAAECPQDALLAPALRLLDALEMPSELFTAHLDAQRAVAHVETALAGDAVAVFGASKADDWMAPVWRALAEASGTLAYRRDMPNAHAAGMLLRGRYWDAAESAIAAIPAWRRIPETLAWMAEACFGLRGMGAWPLLAELAWCAPTRFAALLKRLCATNPATASSSTPILFRLAREFENEFPVDDDADFAWFPAWALLAEAKLADGLCKERTPEYRPAEQAAWTIRQLLTLERQGRHHEIVENRKILRALHPELFAYYMCTRS